MDIFKKLENGLTEHFYRKLEKSGEVAAASEVGFFGYTGITFPIDNVVEFAKMIPGEKDNIISSIHGYMVGLSQNGVIDSGEMYEALDIVKEVFEDSGTNTHTFPSREKELIELEMTMGEKLDYLNNFPIRNEFYKEGQFVDAVNCHRLEDALGGVGYALECKDDSFYLLDICGDDGDPDCYTYLGKEIIEVLEAVITSEKMDLDYSEELEYNWEMIDGKIIQHDGILRVMNPEQYIYDFHQRPTYVIQEIHRQIKRLIGMDKTDECKLEFC